MANKILFGVLFGILLVGCAQFTEMSKARDAGRAYLLGRFDQQICELENFVAASPGLDYPTSRMVQEVIPSKVDVGIELRTKYEAPQAKIRLYGKKVPMPYTKDGVEAWISTIDGNIAKLKSELEVAAEEARIKEEERIAQEKAAAEEERKRIDVECAEFDEELAKVNALLAENYAGLQEIGATSQLKEHPITLHSIHNGENLADEFEYCPTEDNPWQIGIKEGVEKRSAMYKWDEWRKRTYYLGHIRNTQKRIAEVREERARAAKKRAEAEADKEYILKKLPEEVDRINAQLADTYSKLKEIAEDDQYAVEFKWLHTYQRDAADMLERFDVDGINGIRAYMSLREFVSFSSPESGGWQLTLRPGMEDNYTKLGIDEDYQKRRSLKEGVSNLYGEFQERIEFRQEFINEAKTAIAAINAKIEAAQNKLAGFSEDEKYPMRSVRPEHITFMRNIDAGVSRDWLETYLVANRIDFKVNDDKADLSAEVDGRKVSFYFKENVLYRVMIRLPTDISIEALKTKYAKDENVEVKFEKLGKPRFSISPFGLDESGVVPFSQTVMVSFQKEDGVQVEAWGSEFSGLVWINFSGLSGLNIALSDTNTQLKYLKLDKTSRADVVLDANGNVIKCNTLGEQVLSVLQERLRKEKEKYSGDISTITLTDWVLEEYCEALRRVAEEEKERKEAAERKQAEAKALDF